MIIRQFFQHQDPASQIEIQCYWEYHRTLTSQQMKTWSIFRRPKGSENKIFSTHENSLIESTREGSLVRAHSRMIDLDTQNIGQDLLLMSQSDRLVVVDILKENVEDYPFLEPKAFPGFLLLFATAYHVVSNLDLEGPQKQDAQVLPTAYPRFIGIRHTRVEAQHERIDETTVSILLRFYTKSPFGDEEDRILLTYNVEKMEIERFRVPSMRMTLEPTTPPKHPIELLSDFPAMNPPPSPKQQHFHIGENGCTVLVGPSKDYPSKVLYLDNFSNPDDRTSPNLLRNGLMAQLFEKNVSLYYLDELWGEVGVFSRKPIPFSALLKIFQSAFKILGPNDTLLVRGSVAYLLPILIQALKPTHPIAVIDSPYKKANSSQEIEYWNRRMQDLPHPISCEPTNDPRVFWIDLPGDLGVKERCAALLEKILLYHSI